MTGRLHVRDQFKGTFRGDPGNDVRTVVTQTGLKDIKLTFILLAMVRTREGKVEQSYCSEKD